MCAGSPTKATSLTPLWAKLSTRLAWTLGLIALPLYAYKVYLKNDYTDFSVYYRAASRLKEGLWPQIYNLADGASPYRYAPITLPLFRPFAELTPVAARLVWYGLQFALFTASFLILERVLRLSLHAPRKNETLIRRDATPVTIGIASLTLILIFRLVLDSFTIGQVSSLLLLGFTGAMYSWMRRAPAKSAAWLLIPTLFKIGPGILYFAYLSGRGRDLLRAWIAPLALILVIIGLSNLALEILGADSLALWKNWSSIVAADSQYYDASHYGSQSLKSALLRASQWGWFSSGTANLSYVLTVITGSLGMIAFWFSRKPRSLHGRALFFSLGVFPYLWFMPETFKYSLATIALPVALVLPSALGILPERASRLSRIALIAVAATLSFPGKDIVGDTVFFAIQKFSLPFLATVLLGAATFLQAWRKSVTSRELVALRQAVFAEAPAPWARWPQAASRAISVLAPLPMDRYFALGPEFFEKHVRELHAALKQAGQADFEILLVPFGRRVSREHPLFARASHLSSTLPNVRLLDVAPPSTALALREGFLHAQGNRILCLHLEQPCSPDFYLSALNLLNEGYSLVRANRRDVKSRFRIPVRLLQLVYGRHKMGVAFNRLVRLCLPIPSQDTQSGCFVMDRKLACSVFSLQAESGFLFDIEISLIARALSMRETELPALVALGEEKAPRRMFHETLNILVGLPRLMWRVHRGFYSHTVLAPEFLITADDWGISPGVNEGIAELARLGIVRRASAMADCEFLGTRLERVREVPGFTFGLHFDLTHGKRSPASVLKDWLSPFADRWRLRQEVCGEFERQLKKLRARGIDPSYLDGHHHIHLVPGILSALAPALKRAGITTVRIPDDPALWLSSKFSLPLLSLWSRFVLWRNGLKTLRCHYPTSESFRSPSEFRYQLLRRRLPGVPLEVIVHPSSMNDFAQHGIPDLYDTGRIEEFRTLRMLASAVESRS